MNLYTNVLRALFPDRCVGCRMRGSLLCESCLQKIPPATAPEQSFITSVYAYHDFRVKRLVWLLKYRHARHVAAVFAPGLAAALVEFLGEEGFFMGQRSILLVPLPLSKKRMQRRGYNQAELIAKEIVALFPKGKVFVETQLLKKIIETKPQADIKKKEERLRNLGDCFRVIEGKRGAGDIIFLVDDVTTTGATIVAARRVLRAAGFKKVYALTIAH